MLNTLLIGAVAFMLATAFPTIAKPLFAIWAIAVVFYYLVK
tara:strand:+ start:399 stop:521 length:123 start_codon:yes stop_codon:yes gene_type:complete